ncbi:MULTISPECIES: type I-C CRISPR-associated protein Cas8c/Csd1 [Methylocaldum]|jgi:CRISPR-associated protein Csd1|uniref:type I-C CRISPR-associated protein Cas8c/Csd1 n=1 Tax=Methylocaldum sp. RMAD-M TaxID=2806557 RepID=UPI000A325124|nr:type I-C CRISPR-associated protein Cas8c/Csd1 [Methylocaldum sp. RMAD-M]MBP1148867.1 CRISPR-associated protein Csd1 [Methylocaldum sp. RMAD-M]MVF20666.1 type I-C CRISPR-associated protein Cas8c/Csd1 [Methylocaldum sp. BRCS4]
MLDSVLKQAGNSEPGFSEKTVKWLITCTSEGQFTGLVSLGEGRGRTFSSCPNLTQPELVGGGEVRSHFLIEGLPTVALYLDPKADEKEKAKFEAKHAYFIHLLKQAAEHAPYLTVAASLLENPEALAAIREELRGAKAKFTETATLRIDSITPLERDEWRNWWRTFRSGLRTAKGRKASPMRCLVTGELIEPAPTHPKISGLASVGGLPAGDVLVGFDKAAFQSYGLDQSANAAMSEEIATAYTETLKQLIAKKSVKLANTLAVYWYTETPELPDEENPLSWITEAPELTAAGAEALARDLLEAIREGKRPDLANNRYVALMLSGQAGRVMVRDVMQGCFEELTERVGNWFDDLAIVTRDGKSVAKSPKFLAVAGSLVRDLKDLPSPWLQQLWRAAITGAPIPTFALAQAVLRARIDVINHNLASHPRMGLLKAFHIRQGDRAMSAYLNPEHPNSAYHCGRLLAVFARLQRAALGDVGAGVVQRYYTAASQTPGLVLGRLAANAKNHLSKLEGGLAWWYENQIADVMSRIRDQIPGTLTLENQSLFALGYYQQLAALNAGKGNGNRNSGIETDQSTSPESQD